MLRLFRPERVVRSHTTLAAVRWASSQTPAGHKAFVMGGNGALGRAMVSAFDGAGWHVVSADMTPNPAAKFNVTLHPTADWRIGTKALEQVLAAYKFDAIVCAAGGWRGGSVESEEFFDAMQVMLNQNLYSAISSTAARVATTTLIPGGLIVFTGSAAALNPTPGMVGYGLAKAGTHFLAQSLAASPTSLPRGASALCVLPVTIDTPSNRAAMPTADFGSWTPTDAIADKVLEWATTPSSRPASGSLVKVETAKGETAWTVVSGNQ